VPKDDIIGRTLFDFPQSIPRTIAELYREQDERLLESGGVGAYDARIRFSNGTERDIVFHKATFEHGDGDVAGLVGVMMDVTEHNEALQELRRNRDQLDELLAQRTRERDEVTTRLEHEIAERQQVEHTLRETEERIRSTD
jgi:PAS domain-containing protein